jgi:inhibitor of KinA sporulation pathway (predicted exonuclease)
MKNANFFNKNNILLAWSDDFDNVQHLSDAIEDATNAKELVENVNSVARFLTFSIDRETSEYVRLIAHDCWGNIRYIKAWF